MIQHLPGAAHEAGSARPLRVGMFGGAFDPPHRAHRALAEAAIGQLGLDVLHILPTGQAWHKARSLTPAVHRVAMCELAFGDLPHVLVDQREIHRQGPTYTADTLRELAAAYPDSQLYLVLGADQLLAFRSWVRWPEVLQRATLAVADRATDISASASLDQSQEMDLSAVNVPFERLHMPLTAISASAVRAHAGQSSHGRGPLDLLVPDPVASYISTHHLYQNPS